MLLSPLELKVLEDNSEIQSLLDQFHLPTVRRGTLKIAGFGERVDSFHKTELELFTYESSRWTFVLIPPDLWYQMLLPPNFKTSQKYPLLIDV